MKKTKIILTIITILMAVSYVNCRIPPRVRKIHKKHLKSIVVEQHKYRCHARNIMIISCKWKKSSAHICYVDVCDKKRFYVRRKDFKDDYYSRNSDLNKRYKIKAKKQSQTFFIR
jgi:hypothetical protein